jgi:hypothetical protein
LLDSAVDSTVQHTTGYDGPVFNPLKFFRQPSFKLGIADDAAGRAPSNAGRYADVGGHHVHAKRAFSATTGYDPNTAFAVSTDALTKYGVRHADITSAQRRLFREFAASGQPNTLTHHSRIAYQAMVEAGVPTKAAKDFVIESQSRLIRSGIVEPTAIPWGGR